MGVVHGSDEIFRLAFEFFAIGIGVGKLECDPDKSSGENAFLCCADCHITLLSSSFFAFILLMVMMDNEVTSYFFFPVACNPGFLE